jgi:hypothetical protein
MAKALITDCGAVAIGAGPVLTAVPAGAGSTFTVRNAPLTSKVNLIDIWEKSAAAGQVRVTSPNLVPVTNGIRIQTPAGLADFLFPRDMPQPLVPQDVLTVSVDGTAADVNGVALQSYYDDLGPNGMRLVSPGDIANAYEYVFGWPVAAVGGAAAGNQGSTVITTTVDSSDANKWYAVLGYETDTSVLAVGLSGIDTSQLFIGGPGDTAGQRTTRYFMELCATIGRPCIPLFNAANKASTNVVVVDNAAATAANVTLILAQLPASYQPPAG